MLTKDGTTTLVVFIIIPVTISEIGVQVTKVIDRYLENGTL
jgi:hypothetical protein